MRGYPIQTVVVISGSCYSHDPLRYAFNEAAKAATQFAPAFRHGGPALDEGQAPGLEATDYYSPPAATGLTGCMQQ